MSDPERTKKELRDAYEQMVRPAGVFLIRNGMNGKIFVDLTPDLGSEWKAQQFKLRLSGHPNEALQSDWNAQGPADLTYEVVAELGEVDPGKDARKELRTLLDMAVQELQPHGDKGYNSPPATVPGLRGGC